ncbi:MAG: lamin tail domain-containing protein, partial [Bacteroidales bacterium]|nr:lamin tail domain-containing protein [Bacteroidales bacterium]
MLLVLALIAGWTHAQTPDLFFSEYIEGNSNNKALEIYNPTSDTVFLENYRITMATNGGGWSSTYRMFPNGSFILPGDVWVMINSATSSALFPVADADEVVTGTSSIVTFNGDDARGLVKISATDTTWLDIFGNPTLDPGSGWNVGAITNATVNHTLVRKPEILYGTTNWEASFANQWDVYDVDVFGYLGAHTVASSSVSFTLNVNMNYQITSGNFNPLVDSVDVAGSFNGWAGTTMSDLDMDGIYSLVISPLNVGDSLEFKFRINASWSTCELSTNPNRLYVVQSGINNQTFWYDNNTGPQMVTFTVNDQPATSLNIKIKGTWDNWTLHQMYDDGTNGDLVSGDHIWTAQLSIPGGNWEWGAIEDDGSQWGLWLIQGSNMVVTVAIDGTVSGQTSYSIPVPSGSEVIVFNVNMNYQISLGTFNPLTDSVDIAGSFSFWGSAGNCIDSDGDGIYSMTITGFTAGDVVEFKFRINEDWNLAEFPNGGPNRSYTVVGGGADIITYWYSDEQPPSLFFSEYIEGSSNNKGFEIYNPAQVSISLDDYRIAQSSNGGGWAFYHTFPVGASIAPGDVWVIVADQISTALFNLSDADEVLAYPSVTHHNGDDARALIQIVGLDTIFIDVIGFPTPDPGTGWPVAGIANATADKTLVRKSTITTGNTDWLASAGTDAATSEWVVLPSNTLTYLGSHPHPELTS